MEYKLELLVLLVLVTAASSIALSREEFAEALVRHRRKAEMLRSLFQKTSETKALINSQVFIGNSSLAKMFEALYRCVLQDLGIVW